MTVKIVVEDTISKDVRESGHMCNFAYLYQRSSKICHWELHNIFVVNEIDPMEGFQILNTSKSERKRSTI